MKNKESKILRFKGQKQIRSSTQHVSCNNYGKYKNNFWIKIGTKTNVN